VPYQNNTELVHQPLMGELLHLVQRWGYWVGPQPGDWAGPRPARPVPSSLYQM